MKTIRWRLLTAALTAFALCTVAYAAEDEQAEHEGHSALEEAMEEMGGAFKKLSRAMRTPDAADIATYQAEVATIKKHAMQARSLVPQMAEEAGEGKAAMVAAYKKSMDEFLVAVKKLEAALKEGRLPEAQALVGKLNEARKQGHKDFMKQDDD